ncbi:hypothetical protein [Bosea sp. BIWAKO-01]|nr:hypothetical protein [Bosea sp. BIWAKO-01]GAU80344.1 hypothetical protein BIWAKO_00230 [Bosea sp. BIWAKO-01]
MISQRGCHAGEADLKRARADARGRAAMAPGPIKSRIVYPLKPL